jgi:hypothetical protein
MRQYSSFFTAAASPAKLAGEKLTDAFGWLVTLGLISTAVSQLSARGLP